MAGRKHQETTFPEGSFAAALLALRLKAGLSQTEAAIALHLRKQGTISDWERGATVPHPLQQKDAIQRLRRLARKAKPPTR